MRFFHVCVTRHLGGNGRPPISRRKQNRILQISLKKENRGLRPVAERVGVGCTVRNVLCTKNVRDSAVPAERQLYPDGSARRQDDPATIHLCQAAIDAVRKSFN